MKHDKRIIEVVMQIEDAVNNRLLKMIEIGNSDESSIANCLDNSQIEKIDKYIENNKTSENAPNYVYDKMREKGFVYEDGQLNSVKFYTHARINPDVWHTFVNLKHKPSEDTLMKIVIGLSLTEGEAVDFLALSGIAFSYQNQVHKYILACINAKIYDPDEVYEVLEFYKVHNIYAEKKSRKDCK